MASKSKQARQVVDKKAGRLASYIIAIPVLAFLIKMVVATNIIPTVTFGGALQSGGWLGADGENYLNGVGGLITDGLFSNNDLLSYWPAGYPLLIWILTKISLVNVIWLISILQSLFYAYASYYFTKQLLTTKLSKYTFFIAVILAFNPTLSLSSLAVGYESPIAACMLMVVGLIIKSQQSEINRQFWIRAIAVGGFFGLATFMQPRWLLTTAIVALTWALVHKSRKRQAAIILIVMAVMSLSPLALILRNIEAGKGPVISTNIVAALKFGTGSETSGGYKYEGEQITCEPKSGNSEVTDREFISCALKWYLQNPVKTLELSWNKSVYFWSPWFGSEANGTMARNPWLKIHPARDIATNSQQGNNLVYGIVGQIISWLWLIGGVALAGIGFFSLHKLAGIERTIGYLLALPILASWVAAVGTLGDHRFRIPTMSLSLVLQILGFMFIREKTRK